MRRLLISISVLFILPLVSAAGVRIVYTPQWHPQAQFAGYYVALEKGFYAAEGLDVEINHIGQSSSKTALDMLREGKADIAGAQLIQGIIAKSKGEPIVNVMQVTQVSGLWCVGVKPIRNVDDLRGLKIARWKSGYFEFCDMLDKLRGTDVQWIPFLNNGVSLYVYGAVDATLCFSFSEYISLLLAKGNIPEENVLKFSDNGYDCPEDGLYVTESYYRRNKDVVDRFVRATKKGWDYTANHREEALKYTEKYVKEANIVTSILKQKMMLDEYIRLQINPLTKKPDYAPSRKQPFDNAVNGLLKAGCILQPVKYEDFVK